MHAVNLTGVFLGIKHSIAPCASPVAVLDQYLFYLRSGWSIGSSAYHPAKGAVRNLTKAAAIQYAPEGIRATPSIPALPIQE
ncbi:MAG: hypothetical protein CM1200mP41_05030 [Gammaproteobacteria bacterium]|nr:MAG: hypothetical protein CM1200mP41_05030 [Gammaproteobacteria bacterium]